MALARALLRLPARPALRLLSTEASKVDLFNPTEEHALLRETVRQFAEEKVLPQAVEHDREGR